MLGSNWDLERFGVESRILNLVGSPAEPARG